MKFDIKTLIFGIVIGIIISGINVYAVNISSNNVEYDNTNSGLNSTNVEGAINELYKGVESKMALNTFGEVIYSESMGSRTANRSSSITLNRGKYLLYTIISSAGGSGSNRSGLYTLPVTCNFTCNLLQISGKSYLGSGSNTATNVFTSQYYLDILTEQTVVSIAQSISAGSTFGQVVAIQAIPINE